jgi:uncharacterized protein YkwD
VKEICRMSQALRAARAAGLNPQLFANALLAVIVSGIAYGHVATTHAAVREPELVSCDIDSSNLTLDAEEHTVLDEANSYRAAYGLAPLQLSYVLTATALWKASDMATRHYDSHDDGFRTWDQRFRDCGYDSPDAWMGENLAGGNAEGDATLQQWEASPQHNENLLQPSFAFVGIKRIQSGQGDPYGWYWAMELGSAPY